MHRLSRAPRTLLALLVLPLGLACQQQHVTARVPRLPLAGVRFVAEAALLEPGDSLLEVRVRAVNTGHAIRTLAFGDCSMNVGVISVGRTPARKWEYVAWASERRSRPDCVHYLALRDLAPGDSVSPADYRRRVPVRAILGDSLPPGRYRITARVGANGQFSDDLVGGVIELGPTTSRATAADGAGDGRSGGGPTESP